MEEIVEIYLNGATTGNGRVKKTYLDLSSFSDRSVYEKLQKNQWSVRLKSLFVKPTEESASKFNKEIIAVYVERSETNCPDLLFELRQSDNSHYVNCLPNGPSYYSVEPMMVCGSISLMFEAGSGGPQDCQRLDLQDSKAIVQFKRFKI